MKRTAHVVVAVLTLALVALTVPAFCQPGGPGAPAQATGFGPGMGAPGAPGPGGPGGPNGRMGAPQAPAAPAAPVVVATEKVVYLAYDGKLIAFEAVTLKKLAEAPYAEPKDRPGDRDRGPADRNQERNRNGWDRDRGPADGPAAPPADRPAPDAPAK
jgi:hypothetical protein